LGAVYTGVLLITVAALVAAATNRCSHRRTHIGGLGALALVVLDAAMIGAAGALAPTFVWPMAVAVVASLTRIGFAIQSLPALSG